MKNEVNLALAGSEQNLYLISGDLVTVKNSILGGASRSIKEITDPFIGNYSAKELYEGLNGN